MKRLLGAAVLIALAVIFVPMLLPGRSDSGAESVGLKIPPEPSGDMQTRILKVGPDGASAGPGTNAAIRDPDHVTTLNLASGKQHAPQSSVPNATSVTALAAVPASASSGSPAKATASSAPASAVATATPPPSAPAASAKAAPVPGGAGAAAGADYTVNLGIYADHASARKLVAQAKQHGFTAVATPETYQGKSVTRVRVGPFPNRAAAEAARLKLAGFERVSMTVDATPVNQVGDAPASALPVSQPGAWAVQLGAYSSKAPAEALRDRLRAQGFSGYVDSIDTAKGKLWRVRAGPYASRGTAASTRTQIAQKLQVKGNIVTQQ